MRLPSRWTQPDPAPSKVHPGRPWPRPNPGQPGRSWWGRLVIAERSWSRFRIGLRLPVMPRTAFRTALARVSALRSEGRLTGLLALSPPALWLELVCESLPVPVSADAMAPPVLPMSRPVDSTQTPTRKRKRVVIVVSSAPEPASMVATSKGNGHRHATSNVQYAGRACVLSTSATRKRVPQICGDVSS